MTHISFQCPSCAGQLAVTAEQHYVKCEYCGSQVKAPVQQPEIDHYRTAIEELNEWYCGAIGPHAKRDALGKFVAPPAGSPLGLALCIAGAAFGFGGSFVFNAVFDSRGLARACFFGCPVVFGVPGALLLDRAKKKRMEFDRIKAEYYRRRETIESQFAR